MILRFQHKLVIPTAARPLVERATLVERVDQAVDANRIVALTAPAGWGKTMALAQWAARARLPIAWYTLDSADRDPRIFLDYLLQAVAAFVPGLDALAYQLASTQPQDLPDLYHTAALMIAAAPAPFALVLDDFHLLKDEQVPISPSMAPIFKLLVDVAEYGDHCRLVLASRTLPSLEGLVRLLAARRAVVFDYAALRLSVGEVQQLARLTAGTVLSAEEAEKLVGQMSGWVTGIVLSLDQPAQVPGQPVLAAADDTTPLYAYFAEQLLAPIPPELQRFLEDTSVLEDLSAPRCDMLRRSRDSAALLDDIVRRGLFVTRRDVWLSYHSLFREFLRTRLSRVPEREQQLLLRAGEVYGAEDELERALKCYLAAGAEEQAIALLRAAIPRFRQRSRQATLLSCFEQLGQDRFLPPDIFLAQARVCADLALWDRAEVSVQLAETVGSNETAWEATLLEAELAQIKGDYARARAILDTIVVSELPPRLQFAYYRTNGRGYIFSGDFGTAIKSLEAARELAPTVVDPADLPGQLASVFDNLGAAYTHQGANLVALRYLKRADAYWQACGNSGRRTMTLNNLGFIATQEGRYPEARTALSTGLELALKTARRREEITLRCSLADLEVMEGNLDQAWTHFTEAHTLALQMDISSSSTYAASGLLWIAALQGNEALATEWQQRIVTPTSPTQPEVLARKALAEALLVLRSSRPNLRRLAELESAATKLESHLLAPERAFLALLRAFICFRSDNRPGVNAALTAFESQTATLSDSLIQHLVSPCRPLIEAILPTPSLAQHLLTAPQSSAKMRWSITALGAFSCQREENNCDLSAAHQALLLRLLDAGPGGLPVERLWEDVWGNSSISMAAMHQALYRLRNSTGLAVTARDGVCTIQSPWDEIDYDVHTLEQILSVPALRQPVEQAVAIYRGDFFPSAPLSASLWADSRRAYLQQRYLDFLEQYAHLIEHDDPQAALQYYQQILQINNYREPTAVNLMRLAGQFGNRALVNATYEQLKSALRALGTVPDSTTTNLYQQLQSQIRGARTIRSTSSRP
jgi:ATP/maltotriose-dependent transcriptional regulator MalT/DNA-binding SARP family transcriptional activator